MVAHARHRCLTLTTNSNLYRPTWAEIDQKAFRHNIRRISCKLTERTKILAVVKANAYGHMAVPLSKIAIQEGCAMLGVSSVEEGIILRESGIRSPILILGSLYPLENLQIAVKYDLIPTISSLGGLQAFDRLGKKLGRRLSFHLIVDSGMGRVGIQPANVEKFLDSCLSRSSVKLEGIYTHFADAGQNKNYTKKQLKSFEAVVGMAKKKCFSFISHSANSDALFINKDTHSDMVRPGISLYGLWPYGSGHKEIGLKPVLSWKTRIVFIKNIKKGMSVSYGRTFISKKATRVVTLPVGYADGYPRSLSNNTDVIIRGKRCKVIGRVTMDMIMVDVSGLKEVGVGDEVVLIGKQGKENITANELAKKTNTINYEITCGISYRVPRVLT